MPHTLTTYLATVPPVAIAVLIALVYVASVNGRWTWPMLLDGALLLLYALRPSWPLLTFAVLFGMIRHIEWLANPWTRMVGLAELEGLTAHVWLFLFPALRAYTARPAPDQALPPVVQPPATPAPAAQPQAALPMLLGEGIKALNTDPTAPHVGVIGPSRLGKTTFTGVFAAYRQEDRLVIATPKSEIDDPWFGATVARPVANLADLDYGPIEQAISGVHREMLRRNMPGVRDRSGITLILDEWPELAEIPGVVRKVVQMIRRGAAAGIRLIFIATDVNVRSWKMDGMAGVLDNLVFARVEDGRRWSLGRLDANWRMVAPRALDTAQVQGLGAQVTLAGRGWAGAPPVPEAGLLAGLLGACAPPVGGLGAEQTHTNAHKQTNAPDRIALYRTWRAGGIKREQARLFRQSTGDGLDDAEWAEAGKEP